MSTAEIANVGAALAIVCPPLTFVALWWGTATTSIYVVALYDRVIQGSAVVDLGAGDGLRRNARTEVLRDEGGRDAGLRQAATKRPRTPSHR